MFLTYVMELLALDIKTILIENTNSALIKYKNIYLNPSANHKKDTSRYVMILCSLPMLKIVRNQLLSIHPYQCHIDEMQLLMTKKCTYKITDG